MVTKLKGLVDMCGYQILLQSIHFTLTQKCQPTLGTRGNAKASLKLLEYTIWGPSRPIHPTLAKLFN